MNTITKDLDLLKGLVRKHTNLTKAIAAYEKVKQEAESLAGDIQNLVKKIAKSTGVKEIEGVVQAIGHDIAEEAHKIELKVEGVMGVAGREEE